MDKYFEIRVYRLNKKDILDAKANRLERKFDQETWIIAKKVPLGFREIKTGIFIPDKTVFEKGQKSRFSHCFHYVYDNIIDELIKKGSILITDTQISNPTLVNIRQIKEYLKCEQLKFKSITENIEHDKKEYKRNIKQQKRAKIIKKYVILKETIDENIKEYKASSKNNNEIKQLIKKYKGE